MMPATIGYLITGRCPCDDCRAERESISTTIGHAVEAGQGRRRLLIGETVLLGVVGIVLAGGGYATLYGTLWLAVMVAR